MFTRILALHENHIRSLLEADQQLWEDLVNHPFPRQMARASSSEWVATSHVCKLPVLEFYVEWGCELFNPRCPRK